MTTSERLFNRMTFAYEVSGGSDKKYELFACMTQGDQQGTQERLDQFLEGLKELTGDDVPMAKDFMLYTWAQINMAATNEPMKSTCVRNVQEKYYYDLEKAQSVEEIFELCRRQVMEFTEIFATIRAEARYSPMVKKCCEYVRHNVYQKPTVATVAQAVNFSKSYVSQKFREETGVSLDEFIRRDKVLEAKQLLRTHVPILDIASALGFSSQSHFTEIFRKEVGMTPKKFRENNC